MRAAISVIPAQAGNQFSLDCWFPVCAGMTWLKVWNLFRDGSFGSFGSTNAASAPGSRLKMTIGWLPDEYLELSADGLP